MIKHVLSKFVFSFSVLKRDISGRIKKGKKFLNIELAVTYLCNSRCTYCNIWRLYKDNPQLLKRELSTEEILDLIIYKNGRYIHRLSITGGEPFLKKNIEEIFLRALEKNIIVDVVTNAIAYERVIEVLEKINKPNLKKNFYISVSLDGTKEVHDKLRGVPGNFENAVKLLEWLDNNKFNFGISLTIGDLNADNIPQFFEFLEKKGWTNNVSFRVAVPAQFYNVKKKFNINYSKIKKALQWIYDNYPRYKKNKFYYGNLLYLERKIGFNCVAGRNFLFIDAYGNIYPCIYRLDKKLGNIKENSDLLSYLGKFKPDCTCWTECHYIAAYENSIKEYTDYYLFRLIKSRKMT